MRTSPARFMRQRGYVSKLLVAVLVLSGSSPAVDEESDEILGTWVTAETPIGRGHVEIVRDKREYEGRITWLESSVFGTDDPKGMAGQPIVDRENPDARLRSRPVLGLKVLQGLPYKGNRRWAKGTLYDPVNGKTYRCRIRLVGGELRMRGFVGFAIFGRSTVWTRLTRSPVPSGPASVPRHGEPPAT